MSRAPLVRLDHLRSLTDDNGVIQHAVYSVPRRESGYTTDDNARALALAARAAKGRLARLAQELAPVYLAFLAHAQRPDGQFHNFMAYDRTWLDEGGSEDCQGRAAWACAEVLQSALADGQKRLAGELLARARPRVERLSATRALALVLVAVDRLPPEIRSEWTDLAQRPADALADRYHACRHEDWHWFEPVLTYANARLPEGMFAAHALTGDPQHLEIGLQSLDFLARVTVRDGTFVPIGNRRWYRRGETRSEYDQQPVEAACMVAAAMAAWRATGARRYRRLARCALDWFHGRNTHGAAVADPREGRCHDGLDETGLNLNEGAESTLAYLLALQDYARK